MKTCHSLVQKFRRFYFALPKDEQIALYDIMSALRGEDGGSYELKTFTTARVRGALFGVSERDFANRGMVFASLKKAKVFNVRTRIGEPLTVEEEWQKSDEHFKSHIQSAIKALRKHGFKKTISDLMRFI